MIPTYTVTDTVTGKEVLKSVSRQDVLKYLNIKETTLYNCVGDGRRCRKKYTIEIDYQEVKDKEIPYDFENRWRRACIAVGKKYGWRAKWTEKMK